MHYTNLVRFYTLFRWKARNPNFIYLASMLVIEYLAYPLIAKPLDQMAPCAVGYT